MRFLLRKGFSIIEIAVAISIIGILVIIAISSGNLIKSYEIKQTILALEEYKKANQAFFQIYHNIPGDMPDASTKINSSLSDGDGDELSSFTVDSSELIYAWHHLFEGKFISFDNGGDINANNDNGPGASITCVAKPVVNIGYNVPPLKIRGAGIEYKNIYGNTNDSNEYNIHLLIGRGLKCEAAFTDGIFTGEDMISIDQKYDDSAANTGNIRGYGNANDCVTVGNTYEITKTGLTCALEYILNVSIVKDRL